MTTALWFTGLPGSGKSTIVKDFVEKHPEFEVLSMDALRSELTPNPNYIDEERDLAYAKLADRAKEKIEQGKSVIIDATAHKTKYRTYAKEIIPAIKIVHVKCSLDTAIQRESQREDHPVIKNMYENAIRRKAGENIAAEGEVIGVDVKYEEPINPELVLDTETETAESMIQKIEELTT